MMPDDPLVSVIVASYNHEQYIEEAILSVVAQTYKNVELFVIDDGSTDQSASVIKKLTIQYGFHFEQQSNKGLTATLNRGIELSNGRYVVTFGSDDVMLPHRIARQVSHMESDESIGLCSANIELIDSEGRPLPEKKQRRELPYRRLTFDDLFLGLKPGVPATNLMYRRNVLKEVGGFNPDVRLEDIYIQLKISNAGYAVDVLGEVLSKYRVHPTNSYKNLSFMLESLLETYKEYETHPRYQEVITRTLRSIYIRASRQRDDVLCRRIERLLPAKDWNWKFVRAFFARHLTLR